MRRCFFAFFCIGTSLFGNVILLTSPSAMPTGNVVYWSQFGPDQTNLGSSSLNAGSTYNDSVNGQLANSAGSFTILQAGKDWTPSAGILANDALLSTDNGTTAGGPLTLRFQSVDEAGAYIEAEGGGAFTARIQAFAGFSTVLDQSVTSTGAAVFLGVGDTNDEITKVVYSLTSVTGNHSLGNFVIDSLYISDFFANPQPTIPQSPQTPQTPPGDPAVPEPRFTALLGFALVLFGWKATKLSSLRLKSLS